LALTPRLRGDEPVTAKQAMKYVVTFIVVALILAIYLWWLNSTPESARSISIAR
jgi:hypothetical protein